MQINSSNRVSSSDRNTKYITAVRHAMESIGHGTNAELLTLLQKDYASLSATTVHRITSRMVERGELRLAPSHTNVLRFDVNLTPHDHFMCEQCGMLRDANLHDLIRPQIERAIGEDCSISGSLTVSGICKQCHRRKE